MKKLITLFLILTLFTACKSELPKDAKAPTGEYINFYNWGDYIDPQVLKDFEAETGIKVVYDTFSSNEDMYMKLKQGTDHFDIVVPSDYMIERMIDENMLEVIDTARLKNYSKINPILLSPPFDPEDKYSVPYLWGTTGIIYNTKNIEGEITSWADLWNPKYKDRIIMYNSQRDSIAIALKMLGYSMNTTNIQELMEARDALIEQKDLVLAYQADEGRDTIISGDADIGVMYSGDALMMMEENEDLDYIIPSEGCNIWFDSMVIPKSCQNYEGALMLIDFLSRPENAAKIAIWCVGYSSPITEAIELLPKEIRDSKIAYPDMTEIKDGEVYRNPEGLIKIYDEIWTDVITAN
ncbi:MAG: ABC transporter substrate-binding protein [Tissierellia bacterium]|nr:ABC transporter substrate-binding protein [Tissierellia bacterium]